MKNGTQKEIETLLKYRPLDPSLKKTGYKALLPLFPDRTQDALRFKWWELNNERKLETALEKERIGVLDIETTDLKADAGFTVIDLRREWKINALQFCSKAIHSPLIGGK